MLFETWMFVKGCLALAAQCSVMADGYAHSSECFMHISHISHRGQHWAPVFRHCCWFLLDFLRENKQPSCAQDQEGISKCLRQDWTYILACIWDKIMSESSSRLHVCLSVCLPYIWCGACISCLPRPPFLNDCPIVGPCTGRCIFVWYYVYDKI